MASVSVVQRLSEVLESYLDLATSLIASWTPFVTDITAKIDAGSFSADDAAAEFPEAAKLSAESLMAIGSKAAGALAILTSDFSEDEDVSGLHTSPAKAGVARTLTVKADLTSVTGETLPKGRVTVVPDVLPPHEVRFALEVNGNGMKARTYDGYVVATGGAAVEEIFVSVTIG